MKAKLLNLSIILNFILFFVFMYMSEPVEITWKDHMIGVCGSLGIILIFIKVYQMGRKNGN
jgi:hypothetical protein